MGIQQAHVSGERRQKACAWMHPPNHAVKEELEELDLNTRAMPGIFSQ